MITQPPNMAVVTAALEATRFHLGDRAADEMAQALTEDWTRAGEQDDIDQAAWCAIQCLVRAVKWRSRGHWMLADRYGDLAEACIRGWLDELEVRTTETPAEGQIW